MPKAFEVTIQGTYQNQQIINRLSFWNSLDTPSVSGAFPLIQALGLDPLDLTAPAVSSVLETFLVAQTNGYQLTKVLVRNLYSVTDFYTLLPTGVGWAGTQPQGVDGMMSFVACKLVTNRIRTDVRAGSLALTPPNEENVTADGTLNSNQTNVMQDLANALNLPPTFSSGQDTGIYVPSVFKKVKYVPEGNDPDEYAYRYPDDINVLFATSAIGVTWQIVGRVTSQTSRRIGKGR